MKKNTSFYSIILLLLASLFFFTTCRKEYSYEGGPVNGTSSGTAVYTFTGAGGACTGSILSGNYYAGNTLGTVNTVQLEVDVTATGTYNVSTATIDGMYFSASGNFTTGGAQFIILTAHGTPSVTGNFNFTMPLAPGCRFAVQVGTAPIAVATYILSGAPGACQPFVVRGDYIAGTAFTAGNSVDVSVDVSAPGIYTLSTDTLDGIYFSKLGTFSNTGIQTVTLAGSGIPLLPDNLIFTPKTGTSACTFPIEVINPAPLATYVLESGFGTPNPCVYSVLGNYTRGTPLNNSNTVSIKTFVTVPGNFTVATPMVNGMQFSYTGTFSSTGSQFVTLTATGNPILQGVFSLIPTIVGPHPLGGQVCGINITVN